VVGAFDGFRDKLLGFPVAHVVVDERIAFQREDDDMRCVIVRHHWRSIMVTKGMKR
jgi:hypothetical protein